MLRTIQLCLLVISFTINGSSSQTIRPITTAEPCTTPNSLPGQCINLDQCHSLMGLLQANIRLPPVTKYLRNSHCGFEGNTPKVCCADGLRPENVNPSTTIENRDAVTSTESDSCRTPDGLLRQCLNIYQCPSLLNLLDPVNRTAENVKLVQDSICGFEGRTPKVCCMSSRRFQA